MKPTWIVSVFMVLSGLSVTACHRPVQDQPMPALEAGTATAVPKRKPGLWRQTISRDAGQAAGTSSLCLDEATDARVSWWGRGGFRENCSQNAIARQDDGSWRFESVCETVGNVRTQTSGSITGDFEHRYQLKAQVQISNAPEGDRNGPTAIVLDGEWIGACPPGMAPGEMELSNGRRINLLDVAPAQ